MHLYKLPPVGHAVFAMRKRILPLLFAPLLLAGCGTFTNLTAHYQVRNANNLYPVGVAFHSRQQSLRWDSIKAYVNVGSEFYPMRRTLMMTNRWEGLVPVPPGTNVIHYRYKLDFLYNAVGAPPQSDSAISKNQTLRIINR